MSGQGVQVISLPKPEEPYSPLHQQKEYMATLIQCSRPAGIGRINSARALNFSNSLDCKSKYVLKVISNQNNHQISQDYTLTVVVVGRV